MRKHLKIIVGLLTLAGVGLVAQRLLTRVVSES
jgi:hypothetical protein